MPETLLSLVIFQTLLLVALFFYFRKALSNQQTTNDQALMNKLDNHFEQNQLKSVNELEQRLSQFKDSLFSNELKARNELHALLKTFDTQQTEQRQNNQHRLTQQLQDNLKDLAQSTQSALELYQQNLNSQFDKLNQTTEQRLQHIGDKVENKLQQGFEKTSQTFTDIVKRLALIDDAQRKIHDLSSNVVSLQELLQDKRARGAFGEIQLNHLLENCLPPNGFACQYTLPNQTRVDAMLFLPQPTGHIAIDAKFPLESYKTMTRVDVSPEIKSKACAQFKQDIRKHILDIQQKYIIPGETSDGALMFIPAEAVFAEIHANFPELVELAYAHKVWLTSPTTMMAILTTASAVLKDSATKEQVHLIQQHLKSLALDFGRFEKRMDNLAKHLKQANIDVEQVHTTAKKISGRFAKIEQVDLSEIHLDTKPHLTSEK